MTTLSTWLSSAALLLGAGLFVSPASAGPASGLAGLELQQTSDVAQVHYRRGSRCWSIAAIGTAAEVCADMAITRSRTLSPIPTTMAMGRRLASLSAVVGISVVVVVTMVADVSTGAAAAAMAGGNSNP